MHAVTGKESNILPASNHEWRFQFSLPGRLLESLEGHPYSFITYKLKARVERPPFLKDYEERQHIRLIRTVDPLSLELSHTMVSSVTDQCQTRPDVPGCGQSLARENQVHLQHAF